MSSEQLESPLRLDSHGARPALWLALLALALGTPQRLHAQSRDATATESADDSYAATLREAIAEFSAGHFSEARTLLEQAHAMRPSARTLRGLGLAAYELRRYTQAESELAAALRDPRHPLDAAQRREVQAALDKTRRYVGVLGIESTPAEASLRVDGRPTEARTLRLDAGDHVVAASAAGHETLTQRVTVVGGRETVIHLSLVPLDLSPERTAREGGRASRSAVPQADAEPDASGSIFERWWFWTAVSAVVVAGAATAVVLALDTDPSAAGFKGNGDSLQAP